MPNFPYVVYMEFSCPTANLDCVIGSCSSGLYRDLGRTESSCSGWNVASAASSAKEGDLVSLSCLLILSLVLDLMMISIKCPAQVHVAFLGIKFGISYWDPHYSFIWAVHPANKGVGKGRRSYRQVLICILKQVSWKDISEAEIRFSYLVALSWSTAIFRVHARSHAQPFLTTSTVLPSASLYFRVPVPWWWKTSSGYLPCPSFQICLCLWVAEMDGNLKKNWKSGMGNCGITEEVLQCWSPSDSDTAMDGCQKWVICNYSVNDV